MAERPSGTSPSKRRKYDEVFETETLRLASESRRAQAGAKLEISHYIA